MKNGLKLIAMGIALSHEDRVKKIDMLNEIIDSTASAIRSSSDNDGLPHGTTVGDPISSKLIKIERLEQERDIEQERVNAYEWALEYIDVYINDEDIEVFNKALGLSLSGMRSEAIEEIQKASMSVKTFYRMRNKFLNEILKYLKFGSIKL